MYPPFSRVVTGAMPAGVQPGSSRCRDAGTDRPTRDAGSPAAGVGRAPGEAAGRALGVVVATAGGDAVRAAAGAVSMPAQPPRCDADARTISAHVLISRLPRRAS